MTGSYVLDPAAETDIREIARYTANNWGVAQAMVYKDKLTRCVKAIADGSGIYKDLSVISLNLRMGLCEHHYIFVLPREHAPAVVLAVFHERMDVMERLKERLKI